MVDDFTTFRLRRGIREIQRAYGELLDELDAVYEALDSLVELGELPESWEEG